ncbi:MAG: response regulator [Candidatus Poseidoniaceae archaeon]|jgi:CheY-like chemotaxis protein|nr:response regulator [Candidatus Poseidoniaceae archaeon]
MSYVSEASSDDAPTVLIVDNNQMSIMRLREVFRKRGFAIEVCEDGDLAVDEYIKLDPELVVMSLDIPSLDGHLAALEMREHGGDSRILFIAPNRLSELAVHATYSAGAVGWLAKPVSQSQLDEIWDQVLGPIPEAPGLEDIDELYPEDRIKPEPDEIELPPIAELPPIGTLPPLQELPPIEVEQVQTSRPKKRGRKVLFVLIILLAGAGIAYQQGHLDSFL